MWHVASIIGWLTLGGLLLVGAAVVSCWRAERRLFKHRGEVTHADWEQLWEIKPPETVLAWIMICGCGVHWDGQTQSFVVTYPRDRNTRLGSGPGISLLVHYNAPLETWKRAVEIARQYAI